MSSNKKAKEELIRLFGPECFIEKLHLRSPEDIERDKRRYTGKGQLKIMDQLTYHHIIERCRGGKATIENGALLRNINHQWLHRLPESQRNEINLLFQEYKLQVYQQMHLELVDDIELPFQISFAEMEIKDNGQLEVSKPKQYKKEKDKRQEKRELQRLKKEYEDR